MAERKKKRAGAGRARRSTATEEAPAAASASTGSAAKADRAEKAAKKPELPVVPPEFWDSLDREGVRWAKVGGFDIDCVLRGKYVALDKLRSALEKGFGFCDVIFGWDMADNLYDNSKVTGWHSGYPDTLSVLDPSTLRRIPWEPGVAALLCDFRDSAGKPHPACPRSLLKRALPS